MATELRILIFWIFIPPCLLGQDLYISVTTENYRNLKVFHDTVYPGNLDTKILNAALFHGTNEIRVRHKLREVQYNSLLEKSATIHSEDMIADNFFSHTNPRNKKHREPDDRAIDAGVTNPYISENIIEGFILNYQSNMPVIPNGSGIFLKPGSMEALTYRTYIDLADDLLKQWMNSPGHRKNILSENALELGCGSAYYTMKDFNEMPAVKATQNFQWFETVQSK